MNLNDEIGGKLQGMYLTQPTSVPVEEVGQCCGREKSFNQSYFTGAKAVDFGFSNNLDRFSSLKNGEYTRNNRESISDEIVDRNNMNLMIMDYSKNGYGSFPRAEDTRRNNKRFFK
jgi:hypothetical protein